MVQQNANVRMPLKRSKAFFRSYIVPRSKVIVRHVAEDATEELSERFGILMFVHEAFCMAYFISVVNVRSTFEGMLKIT